MSSEVKRYDVQVAHRLRGDDCAVLGEEMVLASDYAALEAECERLRGEVKTLTHETELGLNAYCQLQTERDALRTQLEAIRAAGGEVVGVVAHFLIPRAGSHAGERFAKAGIPSDSLNSELYTTEPLMTVAQHQRIVAAMAAELAEVRRAQVEVINSRNAHQWECERLTAELEAARKQKPFIYAHELLDVGGGVWLGCQDEESVRKAHIPGETGEEVIALYRLPPLAGQVSGQEWVPVSERLPEDGDEGLCALHLFDRDTEPLIVVPFRMVEGEWHAHFRDDDDEQSIQHALDGSLYAPTHWMPLPAAPALLATPSMEGDV